MLIKSLGEYRQRKGHDITVVFDGWKAGEGREMGMVIGGVRVIYSPIGEKADEVIKRIISSVKREWIVVSSDKDIADHAWASDSIPLTCEEFLRALQKIQTFPRDGENDDDRVAHSRRKGNQRQLSKKKKAVARALSKL